MLLVFVVVDACMQCYYVVAVCSMLLLYCLVSLFIAVGPCLLLFVAVGGCYLCSLLFVLWDVSFYALLVCVVWCPMLLLVVRCVLCDVCCWWFALLVSVVVCRRIVCRLVSLSYVDSVALLLRPVVIECCLLCVDMCCCSLLVLLCGVDLVLLVLPVCC